MATIYRIQDNEGRGPYKPGLSIRWMDPDSDQSSRPPFYFEFPRMDLSKLVPRRSGCGFRTLDQLLSWFTTREISALEKLGYSIVYMDAEEILAESSRQLVFTRSQPLYVGAIVIPFPQGVLA